MTSDQIMGLIRQIIPVFAGIAIAFGFSASSVASWSNTALQIAGPALALGGVIWSLVANSKSSIIKSATAMPEVDSKALAAAISDPDLKQVAKTNAA